MDDGNEFVWDKEELTPGRLMDQYDENLPQIIMVTEGYSGGGNEMHQFDRDEICWVNSIMRLECVLVKDAQGCLYSIPLDSCELFQVRKHQFQMSEEIPLQEAIKLYQEKHDRLLVSNNNSVIVYSENFLVKNKKLGFLEMLGKCDRKYFQIYRMDSGEVHPARSVIPLYIPITAAVAVGLKKGNKWRFKAYKKNIKEKIAKFKCTLPKLESVIMHLKEVPRSGVTYTEFTDKAISCANQPSHGGRTQRSDVQQRRKQTPDALAKPKSTESSSKSKKQQCDAQPAPIKIFRNLDEEQRPEKKRIAHNDGECSCDNVYYPQRQNEIEKENKQKEFKDNEERNEIQAIAGYVEMNSSETIKSEFTKRSKAYTAHPSNSRQTEPSKSTTYTKDEEQPYEEINVPQGIDAVKPTLIPANVRCKKPQMIFQNHLPSDAEDKKPNRKQANIPNKKPGTAPRPKNISPVKDRFESYKKKIETKFEEQLGDTLLLYSEGRLVRDKVMPIKPVTPIKPVYVKKRALTTAAVSPFQTFPSQAAASSLDTNLTTCDSGSQKWNSASEIPLCIEDFTVDDVALALRLLNMEELAAALKASNVDGTLLKRLDENILMNDFKCSGFNARQVDYFIKGWRPKT